MKSMAGIGGVVEVTCTFRNRLKDGAKIGGVFSVACLDRWKNERWTEDVHNLMMIEGLNHVLDSVLHGSGENIDTWYMAIFDDAHTPAEGDTYAVPGFSENEDYDETTRPEYVEVAAAGLSTTNVANKAVFTMNAGVTIFGAALVGGCYTKGDTGGGGILLVGATFAASRRVEDGDTLNITYILGVQDDGE